MQTIQITLQDPLLEQAIQQQLLTQRQQNVQELVIAALQYYLKETEQSVINLPKLDPFQHSQPPTIPFQAILLGTSGIFHDIENSTIFAKKLRQQAWRNE